MDVEVKASRWTIYNWSRLILSLVQLGLFACAMQSIMEHTYQYSPNEGSKSDLLHAYGVRVIFWVSFVCVVSVAEGCKNWWICVCVCRHFPLSCQLPSFAYQHHPANWPTRSVINSICCTWLISLSLLLTWDRIISWDWAQRWDIHCPCGREQLTWHCWSLSSTRLAWLLQSQWSLKRYVIEGACVIKGLSKIVCITITISGQSHVGRKLGLLVLPIHVQLGQCHDEGRLQTHIGR